MKLVSRPILQSSMWSVNNRKKMPRNLSLNVDVGLLCVNLTGNNIFYFVEKCVNKKILRGGGKRTHVEHHLETDRTIRKLCLEYVMRGRILGEKKSLSDSMIVVHFPICMLLMLGTMKTVGNYSQGTSKEFFRARFKRRSMQPSTKSSSSWNLILLALGHPLNFPMSTGR